MKRRIFLKSTSFIALPNILNGLPLAAVGRHAFANLINEDNDKVLVLIQMNGGNDGLNTIIPLDSYDLLARVRSNIILPENAILPIRDDLGFHPNMSGIRSLYDDARMTVIQDVGYPNQNRSHFRSSDIWTSGSPADQFWTTGWLGRYLENRIPDYPVGYPNTEYPDPFALSIGSIVSETCQGTITNFSLALTDPLSVSPLTAGGTDEAPDSHYGRELTFLRTTIEQANAYGGIITQAAEKGANASNLYNDEISLHRQLKSIALLISGGLRTKVYVANIGGFDTHANQVLDGDTINGDHGDLLQTISDAVAAFQDDLRQMDLEERVLTMTFSEFGRRIRSNDSRGTDHGTAAPIMLFGSCVKAGILGQSPALPENPTGSDGVPMQFDFRNVYGTILTDWFGVDENEARTLLFEQFSPLPILQSCDMITASHDLTVTPIESDIFPNPIRSSGVLRFVSTGEQYRISLFDARGAEIRIFSNQFFSAGRIELKFDVTDMVAGNYFVRFYSNNGMATKIMVKL